MKTLTHPKILLSACVFAGFAFGLLSCSQMGSNVADSNREPSGFEDERSNPADDDSASVDTSIGRGTPAMFDPGPAPNTEWAKLFAATPNYRSIGMAVLGGQGEKFRWTFGPMFYRGRLTPDSVKVFVIGQEGAQDESISNRSFTGGTGGKMQNFLNHIGINSSYLFMNTFVYTINGQYGGETGVDPKLFWLAQNPQSPIVQHRHKLFNYMRSINSNSLGLVVAVGRAAQDSLQSWVQSLGGKCTDVNRDCDGSVIGAGVRVIGVPHPGAASPRNGGEDAVNSLVRAFSSQAKRVASWRAEAIAKGNQKWLAPDPGSPARLTGSGQNASFAPQYRYKSAPVPFFDFAYGTSWRLGFGSTASNRKDQQRSIQLFSAPPGCYDAVCNEVAVPLAYQSPKDLSNRIPEMPNGEIEWESPRTNPNDFDPGPRKEFGALMMGLEREFPFPNFSKDYGVTQHPSFGTGPNYRGRLHEAQVIILADQESHDDLFTGRALSGEGGQKLQAFLNGVGLTRSYAIVRAIPVDTYDLSMEQKLKLAQDPKLIANRQEVLKRAISMSKTRFLIAMGPAATAQLKAMGTPPGVQVLAMQSPFAQDFVAQWNGVASQLLSAGLRPDANAPGPGRSYNGELASIPRGDLPFHTKWWVGTSGSRAARPLNRTTNKADGSYYKFYMPEWTYRLRAKPMSSDESLAIQGIR